MIASDDDAAKIGERWCAAQGAEWKLLDIAGRGGTAPVFTVQSPRGKFALKILDKNFSEGTRGDETRRRIQKQIDDLGVHDCPFLVKIHGGGDFEDRLYLLMNKVEGQELEKCLSLVPREKIPSIIDQIAQACSFLRDKGMCHRDIKSANVFVSNDFNHATLLDVSVARDIYDPVGLGTDHDGQLPVVATSRYSPPEYLFRLLEPSAELWHALDVYQLGGLAHDLIMRKPMFEEDYQLSKENRYRFAWIVATKEPQVEAADVGLSLVLLARRALDKDWRRRSTLILDDFRAGMESQRSLGMAAIGLVKSTTPRKFQNTSEAKSSIQDVADHIRDDVRGYLFSQGIVATHNVSRGSSDLHRAVIFEWANPARGAESPFADFRLTFDVAATVAQAGLSIDLTASLVANSDDGQRRAELKLPSATFDEETKSRIASSLVGAIPTLAGQLVSGT